MDVKGWPDMTHLTQKALYIYKCFGLRPGPGPDWAQRLELGVTPLFMWAPSVLSLRGSKSRLLSIVSFLFLFLIKNLFLLLRI